MTPTEANHQLSKIATLILQEELDFLSLKSSIDELKKLLFGLSGLDVNAKVNEQDIEFDRGLAIGPKWAGLCLEDLVRTKRFMSGIYKAVEAVRQNKKDGPVTILYAGTGPFATLVLPLLSKYSPDELQLVLLEINEISIQSIKRIIKGFDAYDYIKEIYHCDATTFQYTTTNNEIDVFLVECIQHGLAREPQVAITYNLLPQLPSSVVLIPEEVALNVALVDMDKREELMNATEGIWHADYFEIVKPAFVLNKENVLNNLNMAENGQLQFPETTAEFDEERLAENDVIAIATEITVFDTEKLTMDECGMTVPLVLANLNYTNNMKGIRTQYLANTNPRIHTEFNL